MTTLYDTHRHMLMILESKHRLTEKEQNELKMIRLFLQRYEGTRPKCRKPVKVSTFNKIWRVMEMMFF